MSRINRTRLLPTLLVALGLWGIGAAYGQTPVPTLIQQLTAPGVQDAVRWQAATALATATFADQTERDAALQALREALRSREAGLRVNAANALGRLGDTGSVAVLSWALRDRMSLVRQAAAQALGRIGTEDAAKALLRRLGDPMLTVRARIVHALGRTGQPIAVPALERVLLATDGASTSLHREAAEALERLGGFGLDALERGLRHDDPSVRALAARSLGRIGDPRATTALLAAATDRSPDVSAAAVTALSRLGEPAITPLLNALGDPDDRVRLSAIAALVGIGPAAVTALEGAYNKAVADVTSLRDERLAVEAQEAALSQPTAATSPSPTPQATPTAVPATAGQVKSELRKAEKNLRKLNKERENIEKLARYRWAEEVFRQRIDTARQQLTSPTAAQPPQVNPLVIGVTPMLTPPLLSPSTTAGGAPTLEPMARPVEWIDLDIEAALRRADSAILALGGIGNDEALRVLTDVLTNGEVAEATLAADALGRSRNRAAIPTLTAVVNDATYPTSVRANAIRGLGRLGDVASRNLLLNLWANDPNPNIRDAARQALNDLSPLAGAPPTGSTR